MVGSAVLAMEVSSDAIATAMTMVATAEIRRGAAHSVCLRYRVGHGVRFSKHPVIVA
jgi:hypothetical protein